MHCEFCGADIEAVLPGVYRHSPVPGEENVDPAHCPVAWTNGVVDGWAETVASPCTISGCQRNPQPG